MKYRYLPIVVCLPLFWLSCAIREEDLYGKWQAVSFFENGRRLDVPLDSVLLALHPDRHYEFRSQGFYREAGSFRASIHYLFLTDTLHNPPKEHVIKVLYNSRDSLKLRMSYEDKEQVLFLARSE